MSVYEELPDLTERKKIKLKQPRKHGNQAQNIWEEQIQFNGQFELIEQCKDVSNH